MRLRGHFDAITSSGFAEGWAFDMDSPLRPLTVMITGEGREIGLAIANRYREGLAQAVGGAGWCAFRARLALHPKVAREQAVALIDSASGTVIHAPATFVFYEDSDPPITSVSDLVASDPTLLGHLDRLKGCGSVFNAFIKRHGVEAFVKAAYVFMLGRPADSDGIVTYSRLIRQAMLEPLDLLLALSESDEYRSRPRMLAAPNTPAFPFGLD